MAPLRYVVVTPVKDEGPHIKRTLESVAAQTVLPEQWVIVDDGSIDGTSDIVAEFAETRRWIYLKRLAPGRVRGPGSPVVEVFNCGLELLAEVRYDLIVKLDGDLVLPPSYFEEVIRRFREDPQLGIASGVYCEDRKGRWIPVAMPEYHAAGAAKVLRRDCFREIGGFVSARGWDTVDEIRAQTRGWRTRHFSELEFRHLKPEGTGIGQLRTSFMHGEIYYSTGGGVLFLLFKTLQRAFSGTPFLIGAMVMVCGFLSSWARQRPLLVSAEEAAYYRMLLNRRLGHVLRSAAHFDSTALVGDR